MNTKPRHYSIVDSAIAGVMAGAFLGLFIEVMCFWDEPSGGGIRLPIIGPSLGAAASLAFAVFLGNIQLRGFIKHATIGVVIGTIAGTLLGATVVPMIMTAFDPSLADERWATGKVFALYKQFGILWGVPLGAAVGLAAGSVYTLIYRQRQSGT